jgi:hypothetical protein
MKKLTAFALTLLFAATASAQITGGDRRSLPNRLATLESGAGAGGTLSGCASRIVLTSAASLLGCDSHLTADVSGAGNGTLSFRDTTPAAAGDALGSTFLALSGTITLPTSGFVGMGSKFQFTTPAGTADNMYMGLNVQLVAGYTGTSTTVAVRGYNGVAGTGVQVWGVDQAGALGANFGGILRTVVTTTGTNVGASFQAQGGNINVAATGSAVVAKDNSRNMGFAFVASNSGTGGVVTGGYVGLHAGTNPTFVDSVLQLNNGAFAVPLAVFQDNGTTVREVVDGGAEWGKIGTKTLVSATPTAFVRIAVPNNSRQGGVVEYCVEANDATNYQARCGTVSFSFVNEAGAEAGAAGTPADADGTPTGTLTAAFTVANNAADTMDILANADSSLTETTLRINYSVRLFGNASSAVTPQ